MASIIIKLDICFNFSPVRKPHIFFLLLQCSAFIYLTEKGKIIFRNTWSISIFRYFNISKNSRVYCIYTVAFDSKLHEEFQPCNIESNITLKDHKERERAK